MWQGWTKPEDAHNYEKLVKEIGQMADYFRYVCTGNTTNGIKRIARFEIYLIILAFFK